MHHLKLISSCLLLAFYFPAFLQAAISSQKSGQGQVIENLTVTMESPSEHLSDLAAQWAAQFDRLDAKLNISVLIGQGELVTTEHNVIDIQAEGMLNILTIRLGENRQLQILSRSDRILQVRENP